jgi:hypothetical protein
LLPVWLQQSDASARVDIRSQAAAALACQRTIGSLDDARPIMRSSLVTDIHGYLLAHGSQV